MRTLFYFYKNRLEWVNGLNNQLQMLLERKKFLLISGIGCLALFIFLIFSNHKHSKIMDLVSLQSKQTAVILHELDDINSVLHYVETNPLNNKQQQMALQALEKDIISAQKYMVDVAKVTDIQKISGQIASVKDDMDYQMNDLKKTISGSLGSKQLLDISALPFRIISVDVIAGQPYVSVDYAHHISPLAIGDVLTGWKVVSADYESGDSEFVNEKNQHVKASLQGG